MTVLDPAHNGQSQPDPSVPRVADDIPTLIRGETTYYEDAAARQDHLVQLIERSAEDLLTAAAELGWGSGIPWYDALHWLTKSAQRLDVDLPHNYIDPWRGTQRHVTRGVVRAVWNRDGWECCTCGSHRNLTIDHIVPVSAGGTDRPDNLQTLCWSCNSAKGDRVDTVTP